MTSYNFLLKSKNKTIPLRSLNKKERDPLKSCVKRIGILKTLCFLGRIGHPLKTLCEHPFKIGTPSKSLGTRGLEPLKITFNKKDMNPLQKKTKHSLEVLSFFQSPL